MNVQPVAGSSGITFGDYTQDNTSGETATSSSMPVSQALPIQWLGGAGKDVLSYLSSAAQRGGVTDFDFNPAIQSAAYGGGRTGGWQSGANPADVINSILGATNDSRLQGMTISPDNPFYAQGQNIGNTNEANAKAAQTTGWQDFTSALPGMLATWGGIGTLGMGLGAAGLGAGLGGALAGNAGLGAGFDAADAMFANPAAASVIGGAGGAGAAGAFDDIANGGAFSSGGAGGAAPGAVDDMANGGQFTNGSSAPPTPGAFDDIANGGAFTSGSASPSILDIVGKFMKSGGLAGQIGQALGLSPGTSSALGGLWNAGSGLYGLYQSSQLKKQAMKYAAAADPFGPYRSQYADQLSALTRDPSGITKMPGYEAGLQAVQRSMAAQGYNGSGNMMTALSKYGGDFYNNAVSQLSGLAGAGINPANGAQIGLSGQAGGDNLALNSLGLIGKGLVGMR